MVTFQEAFDAAEAESDDTTLASDPVEDGQVEAEGQASEVDEPSYFDLDQYGDQLVKIKVDGEELEVPIRELPNGYMRQSAFTQKTQALAAERERLQAAETLAEAYERDPLGTVKFLAQHNGLTLAQAQAQAEAAVAEQEDGWAATEQQDPRIAAIEAQLADINQRDARTELERNLASLGSLYGDDFDPNEVVTRAVQLGTTDLEGTFMRIMGERTYARQSAEREVAQRTAEQEAQRTAAKAQLASTVSSASSAAGAGAQGSAPIKTVAEALETALAETGFDF